MRQYGAQHDEKDGQLGDLLRRPEAVAGVATDAPAKIGSESHTDNERHDQCPGRENEPGCDLTVSETPTRHGQGHGQRNQAA